MRVVCPYCRQYFDKEELDIKSGGKLPLHHVPVVTHRDRRDQLCLGSGYTPHAAGYEKPPLPPSKKRRRKSDDTFSGH